MRNQALLLTALSLLSTGAFSATTTTTATATNKSTQTVEVGKNQRVVSDESLTNREDKKFTLNAAITGFSFSAPSSAIEAGYHIDKNNIISLQFTSMRSLNANEDSTDSSSDEVKDLWKKHGEGSAISLGIKHFASNSFYVKGEAYSRNQYKVERTESSGGTIFLKEAGKIADIGASFRIGNQWQWETFTLGCDWFGITKTIIESEKDSSLSDDYKNSISLLNFYIGATF